MERSGRTALGTLGLSSAEECIYRQLLELPSANAKDLAESLGTPVGALGHVLEQLETKGLVARSPQAPPHYMAIAPDVAIEALAQKRRAELDRALSVIPELQARTAKRDTGQERLVELLTSREAERLMFESLHATAREEVVTLVRLPILISQLEVPAERDQAAQRKAQRRGVKYRSVVDSDYLESPGAVNRVREEAESGEEIRVVPSLPLKMVIADRRIAFIPLGLGKGYSPSLVVRSSALVDALHALFELLWKDASPMHFHGARMESLAVSARTGRDAGDIVALMAAGLNDKHICHELGISPSTLQRRISDLMEGLGARTRFQLGWQAAHASSRNGLPQESAEGDRFPS